MIRLAIENKRMQQRSGTFTQYQDNQSSVLPNELIVVTSDDPNTTDGKTAYLKIGTTTQKRIVFSDELKATNDNVSTLTTDVTSLQSQLSTTNDSLTAVANDWNTTKAAWSTQVSRTVSRSAGIRYDIDTETGIITASTTVSPVSSAILFCKDKYAFFTAYSGNQTIITYNFGTKISGTGGTTSTWAFVAATEGTGAPCFTMRNLGASENSSDRLRSTDLVIFVLHLLNSSHLIYNDNKIIFSDNVYIDGVSQTATPTEDTIGIIDSWFCLKSNPGENVQARMKKLEVEPSTHYRFLINNTKNISKINTVCIFNTYDSEHPNDYTVLDRHTVTTDGSSFFIDVDTPSNGAILSFNALMPSSGVGSFTLTQFSSETATIDGRVRALENRETLWDTAISNIVEYVANIRFDISTELDLTTDPNNPVKPFIKISRTGTVAKDAILFCKNSYAALSSFGIAENASPAETTYIYYDKIQQYSSSATGTWAFVADTVNQCFAMRKLNVSPSSDDRLRSTDWVVFVLHLQHSTGKIYAGNKIIYSNNVYIDGELQSITDTSSVIGLKNSWFCLKSNPYNPNVQGSPERAIMKIISATGNTHYRFLISNTQNITDFVTVCIFSDNTYTRLDTKNVSSDGSSFFVDVTTSENAAYLRFNAKIGSNGTVGSLTLTEFTGDSHSIEGRVTALENREILTNKTTCKIFKKVVCCGDSYTAGYIDIHGSGESQTEGTNYSKTNEDYSWVHYMATMTGNNWVNCGVSGSNVLTWRGLYDEYYANYYSNRHPSDSTIIIGHENTTYKDKVYSNIGYDAAVQAGQTQAYVIGLLINDSAPVGNDHHVDLGESSDIGAEYPTTFYGGLSKIIRDLHSISPKAKIFVNTCPKNDSSNRHYSAYNQAVRDVVDYYKNNYAYPVHCIDLANHSDLYSNSSLTGDYINGHYTAIGYEQFAEIYALLLSDYINTHISEFQDVAFIPINNGNGA